MKHFPNEEITSLKKLKESGVKNFKEHYLAKRRGEGQSRMGPFLIFAKERAFEIFEKNSRDQTAKRSRVSY